jgi:hypothetical protein
MKSNISIRSGTPCETVECSEEHPNDDRRPQAPSVRFNPLGAQLCGRQVSGKIEILVLTTWSSMEAINLSKGAIFRRLSSSQELRRHLWTSTIPLSITRSLKPFKWLEVRAYARRRTGSLLSCWRRISNRALPARRRHRLRARSSEFPAKVVKSFDNLRYNRLRQSQDYDGSKLKSPSGSWPLRAPIRRRHPRELIS